MTPEKIKEKLLQLDKKNKIKFIMLFGSLSQGKSNPLSDTDIAVYHSGNEKERFKFRINSLGHLPDKTDLQIFQDLPLPVKKETLSGKLLYYQDFQFAFDEFMRVIKEFNTFEKYYNEYFSALRKGVEA